MKSLPKLGLFLLCASFGHTMYGLGPLLRIFDTERWDGQKAFVQGIEKSIERLSARKQEALEAQAQYKDSLEALQKEIASVKEGRQRLQGTELEYASELLVIYNNTAQVLTDLIRVYQQMQDVINDHIRALTEYKEDPEFEKKGYQLEEKSIYSIEDFQRINTAVLRHENELQTQKERLDKVSSDLETLKRNLDLAKQELADKKQEQGDLKQQKPDDRLGRKKFTLKQQGTLLDAEERLLTYKRELIEARLLEADRKNEYLEFTIKIMGLQLEILRKQEDLVRKELRVDGKDLAEAEQAYKEQMQRLSRAQEEYGRLIDSLSLVKQDETEKIKSVKERAGLSDSMLDELLMWMYKPTSLKEWTALIEIGRLNDHVRYEVAIRSDIYNAKIDQAKARVADKELDNLIIQTWQSITTGLFDGTSTELTKEITLYEKKRADIESAIATLEDKRAESSRLLALNNETAATIKERLQDFKNQRNTTFQSDPVPFNRLGELLQSEAFVEAQKRAEYITQLIELYSGLIQQREKAVKKIDAMIRVLKSKTQSQLVPPLWKGVKKFIPDMERFVRLVAAPGRMQSALNTVRTTITSSFSQLRTNPSSLLLAILYILAALLIYFFLRFYLLDIGMLITNIIPPEYGLLHLLVAVVSMMIQFLARYLTGIFTWSLLFFLVKYGIGDAYVSALFYLLSIPLWLYYSHRFVSYAKAVNKARDYKFASSKYQNRFFLILSYLLSSTVVLIFLHRALAKILPYSDTPRILQAINFIIFQVSLILMISREQLIRLIPTNTSLGKWFQELVGMYYLLFLGGVIFIIVMSNPYIGYGTHFLYLIFRISFIILLVPLLVAIHNKIKSWFARLFFTYDEEGHLNERFTYARTSYGLLIIGSFIFFSFLALLIAANIWGFSLGFEEIVSWLRRDLWRYRSTETGRQVAVNALHLARVFFYVFVGAAIAFLINKFVLRRMFDLLMVDSGVQGIIFSLTRYVIIVGAIIIGLQSIGLGESLLWYLLAIIGGLGFAMKEIVADVFGYFIILIQRPIKIGDFIKLEPDLMGVVRHLNLRSVVIRRRNSLTVLIPNSLLLNRPLINWNYYRTFFAFPDIMLTVSYKADPQKVKDLFHKVLDENYQVLRNPAPIIRLNNFTDNGFEFLIRGFLSHDKVLDQFDIASDIRLELVRRLREEGLELGRPSRLLQIVHEEHKKPRTDEEEITLLDGKVFVAPDDSDK